MTATLSNTARRCALARTFTLGVGAVLAVANGFVVTAIRGAVGTVSRTQSPVGTWLFQIAVTAPIIVVGLVLVSRVVERRRSAHTAVALGGAVLVGLLVGVGALLVDAVVDHALQVAQLEAMSGMDGMADPSVTASMVEANRGVHVRAVVLGAVVLFVTDAVVVAWSAAVLGGRIVRPAAS